MERQNWFRGKRGEAAGTEAFSLLWVTYSFENLLKYLDPLPEEYSKPETLHKMLGVSMDW